MNISEKLRNGVSDFMKKVRKSSEAYVEKRMKEKAELFNQKIIDQHNALQESYIEK